MNMLIKRILCIVAVFSLLLPGAVCPAAERADSSLSIWVASDIHYRPPRLLGPIAEQDGLPGDPLYAHVNTKGMLTYEADAIIGEFLSRFEKSDAKYLLIPGDLSEDGYWEEHLAMAQTLRDFQNRTGKKIFVVPGNHDIRTSASKNRLNLSDFLTVYADIGYDEALAGHDGSASYTADLDDNYRLLAIDACIYREDGSRITPDLLAWIEQQASRAALDGKKLIGMVHHSVLDHLGVQEIAGNMLSIEDSRSLAERFADRGIQVVLTGHVHANDISSAVSQKGNRIYDIETSSLITYPNAYRQIDFSAGGIEVKTDIIDAINISLLPVGFNPAQLALLGTDFPSYSYGYFKAAFRSYANEIPFATGKLAGWLNIERNTEEYRALEAVTQILGEALCLPLYDTKNTAETDSVEEIAALAGIGIEQSEYESFLEIAAVIFAGHYAGDENLSYDSKEVRLAGQCLNAALVYSLTNIPLSGANALFEKMGLPGFGFQVDDRIYTAAAKRVYMKSAAKTIFNEILKPLVTTLTTDAYAPADRNATLEPYGTAGDLQGPAVILPDILLAWNLIGRLFAVVLSALKALTVF